MYYFIIRFLKFYQILHRLHFVKSLLHFTMSFSYKCCTFAPDKTKTKRFGLNSNIDIHIINFIIN